MPFPEIGKAAQSAIYRAGTFGRRPKVPTDGNALEEAARRVMSRRGFAYVAGSAGGEATARGQPGGVRPLAGGAPHARRHQRARPRCRAVRAPARVTAARRPDRRAVRGPRRRRPRGGPGGPRAAGHADPQHPGVGADGGGRRGARRLPGTGTSSTGAATTTCREPGPPGRGVRQRGDRGHPRHGIPRLATARPRPRPPAVRPRRGHRAVHLRPGVPPARRGAGRRPRRRPSRSRSRGRPRPPCARWSR